MSYDPDLADRVRKVLSTKGDFAEQQMMGALCFMSGGHMCCGVTGGALMVRVGRDGYDRALAEPHVKPMEIGRRRATGFVLVEPEALASDAALEAWAERALRFVSTLPQKKPARHGT